MPDYKEIARFVWETERKRPPKTREQRREENAAIVCFSHPHPPISSLYDSFGKFLGFVGIAKRLQDVVGIYYIFYKKQALSKPIYRINSIDFSDMLNDIEPAGFLSPLKPLMMDVIKDYQLLEEASQSKDDGLFQKQMTLLYQHSIILKYTIIKLLDVQDKAHEIRQ